MMVDIHSLLWVCPLGWRLRPQHSRGLMCRLLQVPLTAVGRSIGVLA